MAKIFNFNCKAETIIADTFTPVTAFLRLRDRFSSTALFESADSRGAENANSYICCNPLASFTVTSSTVTSNDSNWTFEIVLPDGTGSTEKLENKNSIIEKLKKFSAMFQVDGTPAGIQNGCFGFTAYNAIEGFENINFKKYDGIIMRYVVYEWVVVARHFYNNVTILRNCCSYDKKSELTDKDFLHIFTNESFATFPFKRKGIESSSFTDKEHEDIVIKCKEHIQRGDVFQIVPSRKFSVEFDGDEFQVYRALRSINPSPFLFYLDYEDVRVFGSSPEIQLLVQENVATIAPIAGTVSRTGNPDDDKKLEDELLNNPKEVSEHVMLVDLARNDLSRYCNNVTVGAFKEVHRYSHVLHLVSKVTGALQSSVKAIDVFAATFPAGTLSGAPKYKAMELINKFEPVSRGFYGGAVGVFGFDNTCVHAITIRSFFSQDKVLHLQSGSGVVISSTPQGEVAEVHVKLKALRKAMEVAEGMQ